MAKIPYAGADKKEMAARENPAKTNAERQLTHVEKQRKRGLKKVCVYVPAVKAYQIRKLAEKLRAQRNETPS